MSSTGGQETRESPRSPPWSTTRVSARATRSSGGRQSGRGTTKRRLIRTLGLRPKRIMSSSYSAINMPKITTRSNGESRSRPGFGEARRHPLCKRASSQPKKKTCRLGSLVQRSAPGSREWQQVVGLSLCVYSLGLMTLPLRVARGICEASCISSCICRLRDLCGVLLCACRERRA